MSKSTIILVVALVAMAVAKPKKVAPQTILVNNMELPAVRTNLSEKDVDFSAEYQYEDGDVVNVICVNQRSDKMLTMEYKMAGTRSDKSIMDDLKSSKMIGFVTKLHSGHNNSYMICTCIEEDDYTKVMVKFVMRTKFNNIVFLKINGIPLQPRLHDQTSNQYRIADYKYVSNQRINVTCEVERTDVKLLVFDEDFVKVRSYYKTELIKNKKAEMRFFLGRKETNNKIICATDYLNGTSAETVAIYFTTAGFPIDSYPLHLELPSNGRVMELYNDYKLNVIYYEFNDGETLQLTCGPLRLSSHPGPVLYLELDSAKCETNGCSVSKTLSVTRKDENTATACYLKEERNPSDPGTSFTVLRELRVILRERVLTTTTSTTTAAPTINHTAANPTSKPIQKKT